MSTGNGDEKDLVARCRGGDDDAWRELVDRFGQRVYAIAYHFTLKREDAEELSQEIFLKIFENLHRYDGGFPLVAWVLSLSRNLCIDRYRRRKRENSFRFVSDDERIDRDHALANAAYWSSNGRTRSAPADGIRSTTSSIPIDS